MGKYKKTIGTGYGNIVRACFRRRIYGQYYSDVSIGEDIESVKYTF
jgi:hypothetical protein